MSARRIPMHAGDGLPTEPLSEARLFTAWSLEPVPLVVLLLTAGLYLWGLARMRTAGNDWPAGRTAAFLLGGVGSMALATLSPLATYDRALFSVHMIQHMLLAMIGPIFLVLGAPITLALRTVPGSARRMVLAVLGSAPVRVLTFPAFAGVAFVATPFALYFSGLYEQTLRHSWLHELNHLHFVFIGCLWFATLIGVDPLPHRAGYPLRVIAAFATLPFHAFLGVLIMSAGSLIAADWYGALELGWGSGPLADQRLAGGILWAGGDLIGLLVLAALFVQWMRASEREARREDRRLDRLEERAAAAAAGEGRSRPASVAFAPTPLRPPDEDTAEHQER